MLFFTNNTNIVIVKIYNFKFAFKKKWFTTLIVKNVINNIFAQCFHNNFKMFVLKQCLINTIIIKIFFVINNCDCIIVIIFWLL